MTTGAAASGQGWRHGRYAYTNHMCRCEVCTADHALYMREQRDLRRSARVLINGRLTATTAARHGTTSTYSNHSCRCHPCTEANTADRAYDYHRRTR